MPNTNKVSKKVYLVRKSLKKKVVIVEEVREGCSSKLKGLVDYAPKVF
jgi:hypothetical protein